MSGTVQTSVLLVAASSATSGGGEKHVADLLRRLPERGLCVSLACPAGGDLPGLAEELGIRVYPAELSGGLSPSRIHELSRTIEDVNPSIVHAHGSRAAFFARLADSRSRRRVVYTVHGIHADVSGSPLRRAAFTSLERLLRRRTALFIAVCRSDVIKGARLGILDADRTVVVYNGVDATQIAQAASPGDENASIGSPEARSFRAELGIDEAAIVVLSIGRAHPQKDHATLLQAWKMVSARLPDARLVIVGSGPLENELRGRIARLDLECSARLIPPRTGIASTYVAADIFALSSRWEGLPYVLLEAMAAGLPVVSTAVDGVGECVVDRKTGLLVRPQDPEDLARALIELAQSPSLRSSYGVAGRERVTKMFTLDAMVDGVVEAYERVAESDARRHRGPR